MQEITLDTLASLLVGKQVRISHTGDRTFRDGSGKCAAIHPRESGFDVELVNGSRYGIIPDQISDTWVEGSTAAWSDARRKIEVVSD